MATLVSTESVRRIHVTGDPSAAGSIPSMVAEGDVVIADDTGKSYVVSRTGAAVLGGETIGKAIALANRWT